MSVPQTALVTGASSGIGLHIARGLARRGCRLVLVARRERPLRDLADELAEQFHVEVVVLPADLAADGAVDEIYRELRSRELSVDILVNNAGLGIRGLFAEIDTARILQLIQTNITSLTMMTHALLPQMIERRSGRVLNISSVCAHVPGPGTAIYNASKAYVQSFSEAIFSELKGTGVTVTSLLPGPTATLFATRAGLQQTLAFQGRLMSAEAVAEVGLAAMFRGQAVAVPGIGNKLRLLSIAVTPRRVLAFFSAKYHAVPPGMQPDVVSAARHTQTRNVPI